MKRIQRISFPEKRSRKNLICSIFSGDLLHNSTNGEFFFYGFVILFFDKRDNTFQPNCVFRPLFRLIKDCARATVVATK